MQRKSPYGEKMEGISISDLLSYLNRLATKIRNDTFLAREIREQLEQNGYYWFNDDVFRTDCEQVMEVFATAINDAIKKKIDVNNLNPYDLERLLKIDGKFFDYFTVGRYRIHPFTRSSSPFEMANCLKKSAPQWLVTSLIERQFDIRWHTMTGEPNDYTFYEFCDNENTRDFFKYKPRQAHVKATLYKECRVKNVSTLRAITKDELCPKVYIRTTTGWKTWQPDKPDTIENACELWQADNPQAFWNGNEVGWMDESIKNFIAENADEQIDDYGLIRSLSKPTLYWAVLRDSDFTSGDKLKLNKIGQTQVYVGKANNGIKGRWCHDGDNHCQMMSKCLRNVCEMTTYDPSRLDGMALVDARLTLAKVRKEETAVFVIKTFDDEVEKAEIAKREAEIAEREAETEFYKAAEEYEIANKDYEIATTERAKDDALSARNETRQALQTCKEECGKAYKATDNLKVRSPKEVRDEAIKNLTEAEKRHRDGKRIQNKHINVIPSRMCQKWKPKNMAYGMNSN